MPNAFEPLVPKLRHNLIGCVNKMPQMYVRGLWRTGFCFHSHRHTPSACAQSRWLSLKLGQRSLSSVTSGNKGWPVDCVNARLIRGTVPKPTEGTVNVLYEGKVCSWPSQARGIKFPNPSCERLLQQNRLGCHRLLLVDPCLSVFRFRTWRDFPLWEIGGVWKKALQFPNLRTLWCWPQISKKEFCLD